MLKRVNVFKPKWLDNISQDLFTGGMIFGSGLVLVLVIALWPSSEPEVTVTDAPKKEVVMKEDEDDGSVSLGRWLTGDEDIMFYEGLIEGYRKQRLVEASKTKDASPRDYERFLSMTTPIFEGYDLSEDQQFFERLVAIAMNDDVSPGYISEWEDAWIWGVFKAKDGYKAETALKARKDELLKRYGKP